MPLAIAQAKRKRLLSILLDLQRAAHLDRLQSRARVRWIHSIDSRPRASHYTPWPIHENGFPRDPKGQLDIYGAAFRSMFEPEGDGALSDCYVARAGVIDDTRRAFFVTNNPQVASGASLDALGNIRGMPSHWTNAQKRDYIQHGYVIEADDFGTPDDRAQRKSPRLNLYYTGLSNATPEQLDAAARVDMTSYHEWLEAAKLAEWERTRYAKPLLDPSYAGAPHADCDCMACRPYNG